MKTYIPLLFLTLAVSLAWGCKSPAGYAGKADDLLERKDTAAAVENYLKALGADSSFVPALTGLAAVRLVQKDTSSAVGLYLKALRADSTSVPALTGLAGISRKQDDTLRAVSLYRKALVYSGDSAAVALKLIDTYHLYDRPQEGIALCNRMLEKYPDSLVFYRERARGYSFLKQYGKMIPDAEKYLAAFPDDFQCNMVMGVYCVQEKNYPKAVEYFTRGMKNDTAARPVLLYYRGISYDLQKKHREAAKDYADALDGYKPKTSYLFDRKSAMNYLMECLVKTNNYKEILARADSALKEWPDDPDFLFRRGQANTQLERYEAAKSDFRQVLKKNPSYEGAEGALAFANLMLGDTSGYTAFDESEWNDGKYEVLGDKIYSDNIGDRKKRTVYPYLVRSSTGKYGYMSDDDNGHPQTILPMEYDSAYPEVLKKMAAVCRNGKWAVATDLDKTAETNVRIITPFKYDFVWIQEVKREQYQTYAEWVFTNTGGKVNRQDRIEGGKYGVVNMHGEIVPPKYDYICMDTDNFSETSGELEHPIPMKRNGKWGLLGKYGKEFIPAEYDAVTAYDVFTRPKDRNLSWLDNGPYYGLKKNGRYMKMSQYTKEISDWTDEDSTSGGWYDF